MKRVLLILLSALLFLSSSLAESVSIEAMSDEELRLLRYQISLELASRNPQEAPIATWDMEKGRIDLVEVRRGVDRNGNPGVSFTFSYTNTTDELNGIMSIIRPECYQSGVQLEDEVVNESWTDTISKKALPGATVHGCMYGFTLIDDSPTVDIRFPASYVDHSMDKLVTVQLQD